MIPSFFKNNIFYILLMLLGIIVDQGSKKWILEHLDTGYTVFPFLNITKVFNQGISFGLFPQSTALGSLILFGFGVCVCLYFAFLMVRSRRVMEKMAFTMIISGAIGNLMDRFRYQAVVDFMDFHAFGYHFPAFNVADALITMGFCLFLLHHFTGVKHAS